ncbi:hypothetical protein J22TS3_18220 [Paenibacillus sp. J22TS3]|nr:hypothetical protein J22TS3_18220 [Paenibacillus sp. J22TS3]
MPRISDMTIIPLISDLEKLIYIMNESTAAAMTEGPTKSSGDITGLAGRSGGFTISYRAASSDFFILGDL